MKSIFLFDDYKPFLKTICAENRGKLTQLAIAADCQRSYLSKVLSAEPHLTPDQGFLVCGHLGLDANESEYFMLLLTRDRSGSRDYKSHVSAKLAALKRKVEDIASIVGRERVDIVSDEILYFSAWFWSAVHILTSIPEFQEASRIASRLQIPIGQVEGILRALADKGLVRHVSGRWIHSGKQFHLSRQSPLVGVHHDHWRKQAVFDSQLGNTESLHYTLVQSLSQRLFEEFKQRLLKTIEDFGKEAGPSPSQEAICFNLDLFKI